MKASQYTFQLIHLQLNSTKWMTVHSLHPISELLKMSVSQLRIKQYLCAFVGNQQQNIAT